MGLAVRYRLNKKLTIGDYDVSYGVGSIEVFTL